jgi:hypothetical protein
VDKNKITKLPVAYITTPRDGAVVMLNRWWVVDDEGAYLYGRTSWQCNSDPRLVARLVADMYPGARAEFIPVAYVNHNCNDVT